MRSDRTEHRTEPTMVEGIFIAIVTVITVVGGITSIAALIAMAKAPYRG